MFWTKHGYDEETVKAHSIICIASELYRETNDKEYLYEFGADEKPIEPYEFEGAELNLIRANLQWLVLCAMDKDWSMIQTELLDLEASINKFGKPIGHIGFMYNTGIWSTRLSTVHRMMGAMDYKPFCIPGDKFTMINSIGENWGVSIEQVSTGKYSRYYQTYITKDNPSHNERFGASEDYETCYWARERVDRERSIPYPFTTLVEERIKNGQNVGIEV